MAYFKRVTEADLLEAILVKRQKAGMKTRKFSKAGSSIAEAMATIWMGRFSEDLENYPEESREHKEAALAIGVIPAALYEIKKDGSWGLRSPARYSYARTMRDLLIDLAAQEANKSAEEMAEAYLNATYQEYAKKHTPEKTYRALYKKPGR